MHDKATEIESGNEEVVTCPKCGQRNRLYKREAKGIYKCGTCHCELPDPFTLSLRPPSNPILQRFSTSAKLVGSSILAFLVLLVLWHMFSDGSQSPSMVPSPSFPSDFQKKEERKMKPPSTATAPSLPLDPNANRMNRSLPFSTVLASPAGEGLGTLKVSNGTARDAYVKLVDPVSRRLTAAFYVKSHSVFTLEQIPDGNYHVLFTSGDDWNSQLRSFTRKKSFARFDRFLNFNTTQRTDSSHVNTEYVAFELTLHPVIGGDATTSGISEQEFLKY